MNFNIIGTAVYSMSRKFRKSMVKGHWCNNKAYLLLIMIPT